MYNKLEIKDYITLFLREADENPAHGVYSWRIPQTYYTNQRSNVCTVSVAGGNLTPATTHNSVLIDYANGARNIYSKKQRYIIGHGKLVDHSNKAFYVEPKGIELLCNARPEKITLKFIKESDALEKQMADGCITLVYCYYNAEETNAHLFNGFTNTLK